MDVFLENARCLLETAGAALRAGHAPAEMTVWIEREGAIRMAVGGAWALESLVGHQGARMAYRVRESRGTIRVEGRAGSRTCWIEESPPEAAAGCLLAGWRRPPARVPSKPAAITR